MGCILQQNLNRGCAFLQYHCCEVRRLFSILTKYSPTATGEDPSYIVMVQSSQHLIHVIDNPNVDLYHQSGLSLSFISQARHYLSSWDRWDIPISVQRGSMDLLDCLIVNRNIFTIWFTAGLMQSTVFARLSPVWLPIMVFVASCRLHAVCCCHRHFTKFAQDPSLLWT